MSDGYYDYADDRADEAFERMRDQQTGPRYHPLTSTIRVGHWPSKETELMSWRRNLLVNAGQSADGGCPICAGTGRYRVSAQLPVTCIGTGPGHKDTEAEFERQRRYHASYTQTVPCWNLDCDAPRPEPVCSACRGTGQELEPGSHWEPPYFTDEPCGACLGNGLAPIEPSDLELEASDRAAELVGV